MTWAATAWTAGACCRASACRTPPAALAAPRPVLPHKRNPQHVRRARGAEGNTCRDRDAVAGAGEAFLVGDDARAVDHVVEVHRILRIDAVDAPDHRQAAD